MKKISTLVVVTAIAVSGGIATESIAGDPCHRKDFKTTLYKQACAKGGQSAAKDAAKAFNKEKMIKSCNQCHTKLAPGYELKADGVEQFFKAGGK